MHGNFIVIFPVMHDNSAYYDCWITLQIALKIAASNLYCKITLVWLDSSLSVSHWNWDVFLSDKPFHYYNWQFDGLVLIIFFLYHSFSIVHTFQSEFWGRGKDMAGGRLTIQITLTTTILSHIILTLQRVEIYIFWEGILTVKANGKPEILTYKPFLH